jgi:hypothetical protein
MNLLIAIVAAALGFVSAWQLQAHQITKLTLEHTNERIAIQRASRATLERVTRQVAQAQNDATARAVVLRRESDNSRNALDGLRQSSDAALRAAVESVDACSRIVTTYGVVFAECSSHVQTLARDADQCFSDNQTLAEAWPQ